MTGRRGRPTAADAQLRDKRVVAITADLLVTEGYEALTFDRVADRASVAKRTLYSVFGDRAGLLRAVVRRQHSYLDETWRAADDLHAASFAVVAHLLSDEAVGIHRAIVSAGATNPTAAGEFYDEGPRRAQRFLAEHLPPGSRVSAELLFTALLGEPHRLRLLGLAGAPSEAEISTRVDGTLAALGLIGE